MGHASDAEDAVLLNSVASGTAATGVDADRGCCGRLRRSISRAKAFKWLSPAAILALVLSSVAQYYSTSVLGLAIYSPLDYTPQQTTLFWMYLSWVYWASPVVGWLSDWLVIAGQRRRPTMLLGVTLSCAAWTILWIGTAHDIDYAAFVGISVVATVAQMLVTIPLNGIIVETATAAAESAKSDARVGLLANVDADAAGHAVVGEVQSAAMLWKTVGSLFGAIIQTVVQVYVGSAKALAGAPVLFLLLVPVIVWLRYDPGTAAQARYATLSLGDRFRESASTVVQACRRSGAGGASAFPAGASHVPLTRRVTAHPLFALGMVLCFVFVYNATPDASVMYGQYLADHFLFKEWFLSMNQGVGLLGSCLGCEIYSRWISKLDQFRVFAVGCLAAGLCYATRVMLATGFSDDTLQIPAHYFVPVDSFIVSVLTRIAFMPVLHVASERSPAGFEAFIFELFSVAAIGGSTVGAIVTAHVSTVLGVTTTNWSRFWILLVVCAATKIIPLVASAFLPKRRDVAIETDPDVGSTSTYGAQDSGDADAGSMQAVVIASADGV